MDKFYICPNCQKKYSSRQSLWNHKNSRCSGKRQAGSFNKKSVGDKCPMKFANLKCEKVEFDCCRACIKQPMEVTESSSNEYTPGGIPKSAATLEKLNKLVNGSSASPQYHLNGLRAILLKNMSA